MTEAESHQRLIAIVAPIISEGLDNQVEIIARYVETLAYTADGAHTEATPKVIADLVRLFKGKTGGEQAAIVQAADAGRMAT